MLDIPSLQDSADLWWVMFTQNFAPNGATKI
jgi:hypothetical protein